MEQRFSKDEILTSYLNTVYFGEGAYGIEAAAETYYNKHASELTLPESAMLAGLITSPNHFDPFVRPSSARGRRNVVLRIMRQMGTISARRARGASAARLDVRRGTHEDQYPYPYFVDYLKRWFLSNPAFGRTYDDRYRLLFTGGLRITTTIDPGVQAAAPGRRLERAVVPGRPGRGGDRGRSPHRVRPRDGRRQGRGLLGQQGGRPRQPRHRRGGIRAPDGIVVQSLRARRGARQRLLPRHDLPGARLDHAAAPRRRLVVGHERGRLAATARSACGPPRSSR